MSTHSWIDAAKEQPDAGHYVLCCTDNGIKFVGVRRCMRVRTRPVWFRDRTVVKNVVCWMTIEALPNWFWKLSKQATMGVDIHA